MKKQVNFIISIAVLNKKVLFESATAEGTISGYTTNYIRVVCNSSEVQENTIIKVQLSDPIGTQPVPAG